MREAVTLLEAHYGAVSWQDLCIRERGAHDGAGLLGELVTLWDTRTGVKNCSLLEGFIVENLGIGAKKEEGEAAEAS